MDLENLKQDWNSMNTESAGSGKLTGEIINQMTQRKINSKINKIRTPEITGGLVCILGLVFIGYNFEKLDNTFLQSIALITILLLIVLPLFSFLSLKQFDTSEDAKDKPYVETIRQFAVQKLRFQKYQQVNIFLCYLLLVGVVILLPKFFSGKDLSQSKTFWMFAFSFGYILLMVVSKWVKKYYAKNLNRAEELLNAVKM
ncbi:MAG: hypothetical protein ABI390_10020 [Daejeonella sp.]